MQKKGQSSIEFLLALPIVLLIAIFVSGEFSNLTKTTIALATTKESFYEKTLNAETTLMVKKLEYLICNNEMQINILTSPADTGRYYTEQELQDISRAIENEVIATSGVPEIEITFNEAAFPNICN